MLANAVDDRVEFRVEQRLAATDGDHRGAKLCQFVDPPEHRLGRDRFGEIVVFVAVVAGEIAAADGNNVRQQRVLGRDQSAQHLPCPTDFSVEILQVRPNDFLAGCHSGQYWVIRAQAEAK